MNQRAEVEYAELVLSGELAACKWVRLACQRHLDDLVASRRKAFRYVFSPARADIALDTCSLVRHSKGEWAGQVFAPELWEQFILGVTFGWVDKGTGFRRFRYAYIEIAKKNGKTFMAIVVVCILALVDGEAGAEVYCLAAAKDQVKRTIWPELKKTIAASPDLSASLHVLADNISSLSTGSKIELLPSTAQAIDGINVHGAIVDELHRHKKREAWDVATGGTASRRQPLVFAITTAGYDKRTVCWEQHRRSTRILEGAIDGDQHFAYIATIDEGDDVFDPSIWPKANPNLGISVKRDYLKHELEAAADSPAQLNKVLRLHFDVWTEQEDRLIPMDAYAAAEWDPETFGEEDLEMRYCYGGFDLAARYDTTSLALLFPPQDGDELWRSLTWFWIPKERIGQRVERDQVPYDRWAADGWLYTTEGDVVDHDQIEADIREIAERFEILELGFDPWHAQGLCNRLVASGLQMLEIPQTFRNFADPTEEYLAMLRAKRLSVEPNPVTRWQAGNVAAIQDPQGNLMPHKGKSSERIDGIVAGLIALAVALRAEGEEESVYDREARMEQASADS